MKIIYQNTHSLSNMRHREYEKGCREKIWKYLIIFIEKDALLSIILNNGSFNKAYYPVSICHVFKSAF